jgi:DNA-binding response OmpR family regulator
LFRATIIADQKEQVTKLGSELASKGLICSIDTDGKEAAQKISRQALDLVFVTVDGRPDSSSETMHLVDSIKQKSRLPVIALLSREALYRFESALAVDDFVMEPWDATEVAVRAKRILRKANTLPGGKELIKCGDLVIDQAKYDVSVSGTSVALTFREYELLEFLASNKGRVFTRDKLLDEVWGYDYYGGDRTVDVHIRRLRSKIEDSTHTFIETVRNIGYRFKAS